MPKGRPKHTRKDVNHAKIVRECRQVGIVVYDLADIGGEVPDTIMSWRGVCLLVEIKAPGKRDDLTDGEKRGRDKCARVGVYWVIACDLDDVLEAFAPRNLTNEQIIYQQVRRK